MVLFLRYCIVLVLVLIKTYALKINSNYQYAVAHTQTIKMKISRQKDTLTSEHRQISALFSRQSPLPVKFWFST
jgi:hypothetical protein